MAGVILARTEKRAVLTNDYAARLVNIGTTWTQVRVGMLFQVNAPSTLVAPAIALGLCSGTSLPYGSGTPTHFMGVVGDSNWTFGSNWLTGLTVDPATKVGASQTNGTALSTTVVTHSVPATLEMGSMLIVDIVKGSPNFSLRLFHRNALNTGDFVLESDFFTQLAAPTPAFVRHTYSTAQTIAVDEGTNGALNAINIYWGPAGTPLEIMACGVAVLA